jgi:hypothetical protein
MTNLFKAARARRARERFQFRERLFNGIEVRGTRPQPFGEMAADASFSCTFSYRVPKGTRLARLAIDTLSLDLGKSPQR